MVYGIDLVILVEIGMSSFKTSNFDKENNKIELRLNLALLDETSERASWGMPGCLQVSSRQIL